MQGGLLEVAGSPKERHVSRENGAVLWLVGVIVIKEI
jgi:hypothetical protein